MPIPALWSGISASSPPRRCGKGCGILHDGTKRFMVYRTLWMLIRQECGPSVWQAAKQGGVFLCTYFLWKRHLSCLRAGHSGSAVTLHGKRHTEFRQFVKWKSRTERYSEQNRGQKPGRICRYRRYRIVREGFPRSNGGNPL